MHQSSFEKMRVFRDEYLAGRENESLRILDLGSFDVNGSYKPLFTGSSWTYQGLDMTPGKNVDVVLKNPYSWQEIKSDSADVFISGQAFEHIEFFWVAILEVARVLKPGGLCCIIAPSGGYEHRYPVDCWRFYPDGFSALARFGRLQVLDVSANWKPDPRYTDESNKWRDATLVCKKPSPRAYRKWIASSRRAVLHGMLLYSLQGNQNYG